MAHTTSHREYGLLGYPLGHSFSRAFFLEKFKREGIDADYLNFELPSIDALPAVLDAHPLLFGFNVTIPYKQAVIPFLDVLSEEARAIGAVNAVRIIRDDISAIPAAALPANRPYRLKGYNADIIGFTDSLRPLLQPHHQRALVLGTGGASKAICHGLEALGLEWRYVSRKSSSAQALTYSSLTPAILADYQVIVNCTPLGMFPRIDDAPTIPYAALSPRHLLFDLVYNPEVTTFMREGRRFGATVKNGLEMLHLQALASWHFWND